MFSSASPRGNGENEDMLQQSPVHMPRNFYDGFTYTTNNAEESSDGGGASREAGLSMFDNPEVR